MLRLEVMQWGARDGVVMFVKSYKRDWLFRKKLVLTPLLEEAMLFKEEEATACYRDVLTRNKELMLCVLNDASIECYMRNNLFHVIARHTKKGLEYYCSEKEIYDKKLKRRIRVPEFTSDINKAEFSKSLENANSTLSRIRRYSDDKVTTHGVFLTIENDLLMPNIIFALTNKVSKRTRYLRSYDLNGKSSDRVQMCDYMNSALAVKYDEALKIYDDLHAKHKNFLVNLHVRKENENTPAKDFVYKREGIQVGFRLDV